MNQTAVRVTTLDTELEFAINRKTNGRSLYIRISQNLGIRETWYFGLLYYDHNNLKIWYDTSKKTIKDIRSNASKLKYRVKYYPEDANELIEDITIRYFYLQVRSAILSDQIYCPPDTCVLLASYAAQVRHGDFSSTKHREGFLKKEKILPDRLFEQHHMKCSEWEKNIMKMWQKHNGMLTEDAMLEYLKLAQNLEMYGVSYFDIYNRKGTHVVLGVDALGLNVYTKDDLLNPVISFPWSEIRNINFKGTRFTIKPTDVKSKCFIFFADEPIVNKHILNLSIANHSLYVRRRGKDTLDVQQMKAKAAEQRRNKLELRAKLLHEALAREQAEKREQQYRDEVKLLRDELKNNQNNLMEAQLTIYKLQEQLRELQLAKDLLEKEQHELREMMHRLQQSKYMEIEERNKLEREIAMKQAEVQHIQNEVQRRDEEARKLQLAIDEANQRELELRAQQELLLREQDAERDLQQLPEGASTALPSLVEVNEQLKDELKMLQEQLEQSRDKSKESDMDRIYRENLREGRDKYKTLNEIRKGNTVRRVDLFENL